MAEDDARAFMETARWDWVVTKRATALHEPVQVIDPLIDVMAEVRTACGRTMTAHIPGIFSRMGLYRCGQCCRANGCPTGKGSPKNDDAARAWVESR